MTTNTVTRITSAIAIDRRAKQSLSPRSRQIGECLP